jgi:hypothetical protein
MPGPLQEDKAAVSERSSAAAAAAGDAAAVHTATQHPAALPSVPARKVVVRPSGLSNNHTSTRWQEVSAADSQHQR